VSCLKKVICRLKFFKILISTNNIYSNHAMENFLKKLILFVFLCPVNLFAQSTNLYHGVLILVPNPCTTDPCLPCIAWSLNNDTANFVLTKNGNWICDNLIIDGKEYLENDTVTIIGHDTTKLDINSEPYYELEINEVITYQKEIQYYDTYLYPNPCKNIFSIDSKRIIRRISIYNDSGVLINELPKLNDAFIELDINWINQGTYLIEVIYDNNESRTYKILKN